MKFNRQVLIGAAYMLASTILFTVLGFIVKILGDHISGFESLFIRSSTNALALIPIMYFKRISIFGKHRKELLLRGVLGTISAFGYFYGITIVPAAEAVSLFRSAALFMPFLAVLLLGEKFSKERLLLAIVGFLGVCLILKPGFSMHGWGPWILLGGAVFNALSMITIRSLSNRESAATIVFYFAVCSAIGSFAVGHNSFVMPSAGDWRLLALMSMLGLVGQGFMTLAYHHAEATIITPIGYMEILVMALLSWQVLGEVPDLISVGGMVLIVLASILIIRTGKLPKNMDIANA